MDERVSVSELVIEWTSDFVPCSLNIPDKKLAKSYLYKAMVLGDTVYCSGKIVLIALIHTDSFAMTKFFILQLSARK